MSDAINSISLSDMLANARALMRQDRFGEAFAVLDEAPKLPPELMGSDGSTQIRECRTEISEHRTALIHELTDELLSLLRKSADQLTRADLDTGQSALARLNAIHPTRSAIDDLEWKWNKVREPAEKLLAIADVRKEVEALWKSAASSLDYHAFDRAHNLAVQKLTAYQGEQTADDLLNDTQTKRTEARANSSEKTTQAQQGDFDVLINALKTEWAKGYTTLPEYAWIEIGTERALEPLPGRTLPSAQAIEQVKALARQYADGKIDERFLEAESLLESSPEAAEKRLNEARRFPYASEEKKVEIDDFLVNKLAPALKRRANALRLAQEAQEKASTNPPDAWHLLQQAVSLDAFAPRLGDALRSVRKYVYVDLRQLLDLAQEEQRTGHFEQAKQKAERVAATAKVDAPMAAELGVAADDALAKMIEDAQVLAAVCAKDSDLFAYVEDGAKRVEALVIASPKDAKEMLQSLQSQVEGRPERFLRLLEQPRIKLRSRLSLDEVLADWQSQFRRLDPAPAFALLGASLDQSAASSEQQRLDRVQQSQEKLRQLLTELDLLLKAVEQEISQQQASRQVDEFRQQVIDRREVVQAGLDWQQGLYERPRQVWERIGNGSGTDRDLALEWRRRAEDASAVGLALAQARSLVEDSQYKEARDTLKPWLTTASPRQDEVSRNYKSIGKQWAHELEARIKEFQDAKSSEYAQLVAAIHDLASLDQRKAEAFKPLLVRIYREWAQACEKNNLLLEAAGYLKEAAAMTSGADHSDIGRLLFWVEQKQMHQERDDALQPEEVVKTWLIAKPFDIEGLDWMLERMVESERTIEAVQYLERAERHLRTAAHDKEPFAAGLTSDKELDAWLLTIVSRRHQVEVLGQIVRYRKNIEDKLRPEKPLDDYRMARVEKDAVLGILAKKVQELGQAPGDRTAAAPGEVRTRTTSQDICVWIEAQAAEGQGIRSWYAGLESKLVAELRERWQKTDAVTNADLRESAPARALRERWELGHKIGFLFSQSNEDLITNQEIVATQARLRDYADHLLTEKEGPGLAYPVEPSLLYLRSQQQWAMNLIAWAQLIAGLPSSGVVGSTAEDEYATKAGGTGRSEIGESLDKLQRTQEDLLQLETVVAKMEARLKAARSAGSSQTGVKAWRGVSWRSIVELLLGANPTLTYWQSQKLESADIKTQLANPDPEKRYTAWQHAADALEQAQFDTIPDQAPWPSENGIDAIILRSGVEELWAEVLAPLRNFREFESHLTIIWLRNEYDQAVRKRRKLVLCAALLFADVQADDYGRALRRMDTMESEDPEDDFGFRNGSLFGTPKWQPWDELKKWLGVEKERWDDFLTTWTPIHGCALDSWRDQFKGEFISAYCSADYDRAWKLAKDALDGRQAGGITNELGGVIALKPALDGVRQLLAQVSSQETKSRRTLHALLEVAQRKHDLQEAVDEITYWLSEGSREHTSDPSQRPLVAPDPIAVRKSDFEAKKADLEEALLKFEGSRWPSKRRRYREWSRDLLVEMEKIAPKWPQLIEYKQRLEA